MEDNDPFADFEDEPGDVERTIILPAPGGRARATGESFVPPRPEMQRPAARLKIEGSGENPLSRAAGTAFALVRRLRDTPQHNDVPALRDSVLSMIKEFEATARNLGSSPESAYAARYALCALIDETVLATPWGSRSIWHKQSLLATLHNEVKGGAKFFQILDHMLKSAAQNIDLLELLYCCLALGFQGQYAVLDRGAGQLEEITHNLYRTIRNHRGEPERELSPHWKGITDRRMAVARYVPLWVVPVVVAAIGVVLYLGYSFTLTPPSDTTYVKLSGLGEEAAQQLTPPNPFPLIVDPTPRISAAERIRGLLAEEVALGLVDVIDLGYATRVIVFNKGLFPSGRASVVESHEPLIRKIGSAISEYPGPIQVVGHTDSQPIHTLAFPSNWHLSSARAESVLALMAETIGAPDKLVAEGRGDEDPLASNETAAGRQQNRRVEIKVPVQ